MKTTESLIRLRCQWYLCKSGIVIFVMGVYLKIRFQSIDETTSGKIVLKTIILATRRNSITMREYFKNATNQSDRSNAFLNSEKSNICAFSIYTRTNKRYRTGLSYRVIVQGYLQIMRLQGQLKALKLQLFDGRTGILKTILSKKNSFSLTNSLF